MGNTQKKNTVQIVRELAEPIVEALQLQLWDVRFVKEGASWFLRIFIDKEGGISIEDCENVSRTLDARLDELDPIEQSYYLEVSSPGMGRLLTRDEHFAAMRGQPIKVRLIRPLDNQRDFAGTLLDYQEDTLRIQAPGGQEHRFEKAQIATVRLDDEDAFL